MKIKLFHSKYYSEEKLEDKVNDFIQTNSIIDTKLTASDGCIIIMIQYE